MRAVGVAWALHGALALGLCFVPLFDTLGFERAFAAGLLSALTAPAVALALLRRARARRGAPLLAVGGGALAHNLALLAPHLVAGVGVELVNQPCDQQEGLLFLVLLAGGNAAFGTALGLLAGALAPRPRWAGAAVALTLLGAVAAALYRVYAEPQIFIYSAPFGFWPGSLYDEELTVSAALWAFRGYTLAFAATLALLARAFTDAALAPQRLPRPLALGAAALAGLATWGAHQAGGELGFDLDRSSVQDALSLRLETEHFVIYADPALPRAQLPRLLADHELRWAQLHRFFGVAPEGRITSFVYRDTDQKARLMGAGRTQIARPWAQEIHIHGFEVPHGVLKHELAHIFAGALARPPFRVPARAGIFVNIGVVEGVAVAADWPVQELTVHGWTRAMRALGLAPDLRRSLSPAGFWAVASSLAYTSAGSFVRYLVDTHGIEKLAVLYAEDDFEAAYGRPLDALVTEWEAFIDALPLPEAELVLAEHRFKRPSIFQKVCPHQAANVARRAHARLGGGDLEGGRADVETLLGYSPQDPGPLVLLAEALAREERLDEAQATLTRAAEVPASTEKARAQVREAQGGLAWRRGAVEEAQVAFQSVLALHLSTPSDRLQAARLGALTRPPEVQAVLRPYLAQELSFSLALVRLGALAQARPGDGLLQYLWARALERSEAFPEGVAAARAARRAGLPTPSLEVEAALTEGRLLLWAGSATTAADRFLELVQAAPSPAVAAEAEDWWARARFMAEGALPEAARAAAGPAPGEIEVDSPGFVP